MFKQNIYQNTSLDHLLQVIYDILKIITLYLKVKYCKLRNQ